MKKRGDKMKTKNSDSIKQWAERANQLIAESPFAERLQPLVDKPWWGQIPYEMIYEVQEYANRSQIPDPFNPNRIPNSYGTLFYIFGITKAERPLFIAENMMERYLELCDLPRKDSNSIISFWSPKEELLHAGLDLGHAQGDGVIFHQPLPKGAAYELLPSSMVLSQLPKSTSYRYHKIKTGIRLDDLIKSN